MSLRALQEYTRYAKYSRYRKDKGRRETWEEQVNRVFDMHEVHLGERLEGIKEDFYFAKEMMLKKRILGSQRALQFGGNPILRHNEKIFNCSAGYADRVKMFQEFEFLLLCGCGVGISVQKHHVNKLPEIKERTKKEKTFIIPDSIEGWADAIGVLVSSYFVSEQSFPEYAEHKVIFDFSQIRPEGAPISWGGKAPGPKGLENAINKITSIFERTLEKSRTRLKPIDVYDILMHESDACLSGGIRRSACIILFSYDDEEMANAKTGSWFIENPQRARSNNSAVLLRDKTTKEEFSGLMRSVKEFGEPGFIWTDDTEVLFNPCLSKRTWIMTDVGGAQVKELIGKKFTAIIDGRPYSSTEDGFYKTGVKQLFKIKTNQGFEVEGTDNHMFLVDSGDKLEWTELKDIRKGDKIVVNNHYGYKWHGGNGSFGEGWLVGNLKGDGSLTQKTAYLDYWGVESGDMLQNVGRIIDECNIKHRSDSGTGGALKIPSGIEKRRVGCIGIKTIAEQYGLSPTNNKFIGGEIEKSSYDFHRGFISGWFDADGTVIGDQNKGVSVRLSSIDLDGLMACQRMLLRLGIMSKIYQDRAGEGYRELPDGKGGTKLYYCQSNHELMVSRDSLVKFRDIVGFTSLEKREKLDSIISNYKRTPYKDKFVATVSEITEGEVEDVYDCTIPNAHCFDANGFMSHNCCEISLYGYDEFGNSGFEFCNLTTINAKKAKTAEMFYESCRASAILGTIQASYDTFNYLGEVTQRICRREALLGCSITGIMDNPDIALNPEIQNKGAEIIKEVNKVIASKIGINQAARTTTIKPEGSASALLGSSSGIHPNHAERYIRRVQANKNEFPVLFFKTKNNRAVEESVWSANKTDYVISFLCEVPKGARLKSSTTAISLLESVKLTQQNWVTSGKNESLCVQPWLNHNVSNTISVQENEWNQVEDFIYENRKWFAGISLLPASGDLDYPQAPFTTVFNQKEIIDQFGEGALFASGLIVDGLAAFDDNLWKACDTALKIGEKITLGNMPEEPDMPHKNGYTNKQWTIKLSEYSSSLSSYYVEMEYYNSNVKKLDWVRRFDQFADRYCGGDKRKCSHLMKHVHNWKLWLDLKREYVDVDWSEAREEEFELEVNTLGAQACAGGKCELF